MIKIEYYISENAVDNTDSISTASWLTYDVSEPITLNQNKTNYVYVRAKDNAGHESVSDYTVVIYSDSVLDKESKNVTFDKNKPSDITIKISLNGNTVKEIRNNENNNTLKNETDYKKDENEIILKKSYLQTLSTGNYTLTVLCNPLDYEDYQGDAINLTIELKVTDSGEGSVPDPTPPTPTPNPNITPSPINPGSATVQTESTTTTTAPTAAQTTMETAVQPGNTEPDTSFEDVTEQPETTHSESDNISNSDSEQTTTKETAVGNENNSDNPPKTGNVSGVALMIGITAVSLIGIGGATLYNRKRKR